MTRIGRAVTRRRRRNPPPGDLCVPMRKQVGPARKRAFGLVVSAVATVGEFSLARTSRSR
ncbi:MAG: hypothetical protein D6725_10975 [Planctomycetota bacterium]|nr:MAG: hypothetical protein D6725_10975 [Planctomycetota bacterium]